MHLGLLYDCKLLREQTAFIRLGLRVCCNLQVLVQVERLHVLDLLSHLLQHCSIVLRLFCALGLDYFQLPHFASVFFAERGSTCNEIIGPRRQAMGRYTNARRPDLVRRTVWRPSLLRGLGYSYAIFKNIVIMSLCIWCFSASIHFIIIIVWVILGMVGSRCIWLCVLLDLVLNLLGLVKILELTWLDYLFPSDRLLLEIWGFKI